jgi:dTDP-4-amino-4,6-dideoxygalactose transaminase
MSDTIFVTQPNLPSLEDFTVSLRRIWDSKILTNNGDFHKEFERKLAEYLGVKYISAFSNGTIALLTALQALNIRGEVITTPYSFVATANSLIWNRVTPVFSDVDPVFGNLDSDKIEQLINERTTAIMPVHVYGNPCDVEKLEALADKYNLKIIYDAAHAFGVKKGERSILEFGDLSVLSFHATKTFNTIEGGAIISNSLEMKTRIDNLKNFGITDEVTVVEPGINGKMNELQAAFGLLQLMEIDTHIATRRALTELYRNELSNTPGIRILNDMSGITHNYSYFPIFVQPEFPISRDELYEQLKKVKIFGRRYFYPLISTFSPYRDLPSAQPSLLPIAHRLANEVLCLPIYSGLNEEIVLRVCKTIKCLIP